MVYQILKEILRSKQITGYRLMCKPGHTVALSIDVEQAELAHLVKEAYAFRSS